MEQTNVTQIRQYFQAETSLLRLERQAAAAEAALNQARYDFRQARQAQVLYSGSFKSFLDQLTGKREAAETALLRAVKTAEAALASAQREKEWADRELPNARLRLDALSQWETLPENTDEESKNLWFRLEAQYCTEVLLPLLEGNLADLEELRRMISGANAGKIYSYGEQAEIQTAPEESAKICAPYLLRLRAAAQILGFSLPRISYFEDPTGFLNAAAAAHNRRDRLNEAMDQAEAVLRALPPLQAQLEE